MPDMAAPTPSARATPSGKFLENQFRTHITLGNINNISFWEQTVKPPGFSAGGPIKTSTMFNVRYHTQAPKKLLTTSDITGKAGYDPIVGSQVIAQAGIPQSITVTHPDGSTEAHWGWLDEWMPGENTTEDGFPTADYKICISNWDETNDVEAGPAYNLVSGT
jgi:hypothetical protein